MIYDKEYTANAFSEYFSSVAQTIIDDLNNANNKSDRYQPITIFK
jgi:hypothetical protein